MTVAALNAHLDAFEHALGEQELDNAEAILGRHDDALHALLQQPIDPAQASALRTLLQRQQSILGKLGIQREAAASLVREGQRTTRAVNAYQQAGALP
ncbi:hypothetical protein ABB26_14910 [Stenotrophomonas humi]|uniref:Flagellar protein FliT n=1 Tax=Stenotrophomonas humi TaxID=405444 RepID=A0A0R0BZ24_9GAMM|nr:hypothetical protein [Stenotrophomonas humi]KRG62959.1 hypothetical protein ABB26_14910 [Stenotrophomonas humi]